MMTNPQRAPVSVGLAWFACGLLSSGILGVLFDAPPVVVIPLFLAPLVLTVVMLLQIALDALTNKGGRHHG